MGEHEAAAAAMPFARAQALFAKYDCALTEANYQQLTDYAACLMREGRTHNLTKILSPEEIWVRHFLDSAYLLRHLQGQSISRILDVGTGAGVPGIPLAILCNAWEVTLLDSEAQKLAFCQSVVTQLGLRVNICAGRAEELAHTPALRGQFDAVVSRAVANGSMLCELCVPFLAMNGRFLAMKGASFDDSVERFACAAPVLGAERTEFASYTLEETTKTLVIATKSQDTPAQYPRRFAKMKRSPL